MVVVKPRGYGSSGVAACGVCGDDGTMVMVVVILGTVAVELLLVVGSGDGDSGDGNFGIDGGDGMN